MPVDLPDDAAPDPQVWVGTFKVTLENGEGSTELVGWDSLGMYASDAEFNARQESETNAREKLIRSQFADQGMNVRRIELQRVGKFTLSK
jgi:hypothetical protein